MSGVLDLFGDDPDAEAPIQEQPFLVYSHSIDLHADTRGRHQWDRQGSYLTLVEASDHANRVPTHTVVYQRGHEVHSNGQPPLPKP